MIFNENQEETEYMQQIENEANYYNKNNKQDGSYTLLIVLLLIIFFMYAYYQEERYTKIEQRLQKIEQYTNYLF